MGEFATFLWGCVCGGWVTGLFIMRWLNRAAPSNADTVLSAMAGKIDRTRVFAPDLSVSAERDVLINGKPYHIKITPEVL